MKTVTEIATNTFYTLTPDTGVISALRLAQTDNVKYLFVLDNGVLAEIVSIGDLLRAKTNSKVADCMSAPVLCVAPYTTTAGAENLMDERKVSCLGLVGGGFLLGYITRMQLTSAPRVANNDNQVQELFPN